MYLAILHPPELKKDRTAHKKKQANFGGTICDICGACRFCFFHHSERCEVSVGQSNMCTSVVSVGIKDPVTFAVKMERMFLMCHAQKPR